jgi:hypothetical protein
MLRLLSAPVKHAVTTQLQFYLSKYIKDIDIEGLGVFGDIVLHNLELRRDVIREQLEIPATFDISVGFIKEVCAIFTYVV